MFPDAQDGIKKIRTADLLVLITAVISLVLGILSFLAGKTAGDGTIDFTGIAGAGILGAIAAILFFVAFILDLVGLSRASRDEKSFKNALVLTLLGIIVSVVAGAFSKNATLNGIFTTVSDLINVAVFVMVVRGIMNLARRLSREDMQKKGGRLIKMMAAVYVIAVVVGLIGTLMQRNPTTLTIASILLLAGAVLEIIVFLSYFGYLGKAVKMLDRN